jgi:hypothetical protein
LEVCKRLWGHCSPIDNPFKEKNSFRWNDQAKEAFKNLKDMMSTPLVLGLPDFTKKFVIECDASGIGIWAVLMQEGRPLAYLS